MQVSFASRVTRVLFRCPPALFVAVIVATSSACSTLGRAPEPRTRQVTFVCEHGNVKSLIAASYFNRVAGQRGLDVHAVARGTAIDSNTVPDAIGAALQAEGFDVRDFRPVALSEADVAASEEVITIGLTAVSFDNSQASKIERWNDVPAASTNFDASFATLKTHVERLVDRLAASRR